MLIYSFTYEVNETNVYTYIHTEDWAWHNNVSFGGGGRKPQILCKWIVTTPVHITDRVFGQYISA